MNARFYFWGPALGVGPTCTSSHTVLHRVATSHTESSQKKIQSISIKFYSVNARFYFLGPALDVGSTCSFSHTALQRVAASHTESSQKISINFDKIL